jgi:RNA polymerase sigma-70 factor, ECF subfamily
MASDADKLLIEQIRRADPRAWEQLIHKYEGRLLAFAIRRLRDRSMAEDVVQETFIGFLNSVENFDPNRELQTYLFTIASYKITDQLRRMGRKPVQTGEAAEDRMAEKADDAQRKASDLARSRERVELENAALARALKQLVQGLIDKNEIVRVQALELLFVKGWANKDVARFLDITEQQVANYRFAAVKKLTEQMHAAGLPTDVFPELRATPG